jgi:CheY-like chemotaxis protein
VVDDDPSVLDCYRKLLGRAGYKTVTESDPRRVLMDGRDLGEIDLLLIDYKMPEMDGLTLLAELRRREFRARCVLVSAFLNDGVRQQARHLGVDHILEKPVDVASLRSVLADLLPTEGGRVAGQAG